MQTSEDPLPDRDGARHLRGGGTGLCRGREGCVKGGGDSARIPQYAAYFKSESELLYHDEIHGDLFTQAEKTIELLLTKYLKAAISYRGIHRVESLPVPEAAIREAVLNAIIHRDYSVGAPIQIRVHADRLRIWNPGELPENWSLEKLFLSHSSRPFNPSVANAFFRAGEIEAWGRGIQQIVDACRNAGAPEPRMHYEPGDLWIEFPFPPAYLEVVPDKAGSGREAKTREKTRKKTREKILGILRDDPGLSIAELAKRIGITQKGAEWQIQKLKDEGLLVRQGPDKGGRWGETRSGVGQPERAAQNFASDAQLGEVVPAETTQETPGTTQETAGTTQETTQETTGTTQETPRTTQETTQESIVALLRAEPTLTRKALADRIGVSADGIKYHLDKLRSEGRIRRVGPTKAGRWEVLK